MSLDLKLREEIEAGAGLLGVSGKKKESGDKPKRKSDKPKSDKPKAKVG